MRINKFKHCLKTMCRRIWKESPDSQRTLIILEVIKNNAKYDESDLVFRPFTSLAFDIFKFKCSVCFPNE